MSGSLGIPGPEAINSTEQPDPIENPVLPYVIVGDDAFPLKENIMKPYAQNNLNLEKGYLITGDQ